MNLDTLSKIWCLEEMHIQERRQSQIAWLVISMSCIRFVRSVLCLTICVQRYHQKQVCQPWDPWKTFIRNDPVKTSPTPKTRISQCKNRTCQIVLSCHANRPPILFFKSQSYLETEPPNLISDSKPVCKIPQKGSVRCTMSYDNGDHWWRAGE